MELSRRHLLSASALLVASPGALRAAAPSPSAPAARASKPIILCWNENPYGPSPAARVGTSIPALEHLHGED